MAPRLEHCRGQAAGALPESRNSESVLMLYRREEISGERRNYHDETVYFSVSREIARKTNKRLKKKDRIDRYGML